LLSFKQPYFLKLPKTYTAEEIIAAGGTTAFGKQTGYDPKKFYDLKGEGLSNEEIEQALKMLLK
jgi:hypothetical protein